MFRILVCSITVGDWCALTEVVGGLIDQLFYVADVVLKEFKLF